MGSEDSLLPTPARRERLPHWVQPEGMVTGQREERALRQEHGRKVTNLYLRRVNTLISCCLIEIQASLFVPFRAFGGY